MELNQLIERTPLWLSGEGEMPELVLSSRARIARNLESHPFSYKMKPEERKALLDEIMWALRETPYFKDAVFLDIGDLGEEDRLFLIERHLFSVPFWGDGKGSGIILTADETLSVVINEEDHLRIQVLSPGLSLRPAFERILEVDEVIGQILEYAYRENFGYLTSCPTNTGTGLRLSVLIHLPGVVYAKQLDSLFKNLKKVKVSVRGLYGEGSEVQGNIFQISSVLSLGISEEETYKSFKEIVDVTIDFERKAREILMQNMRSHLEDKIYRSLALLKNARLLTFKETAEYTSAVRLGVGLGFFLDIKIKTLNELLLFSQPVHLQKLFGKEMDPTERDQKRAFYVKTKLEAG
jgi:protein arginine kinase